MTSIPTGHSAFRITQLLPLCGPNGSPPCPSPGQVLDFSVESWYYNAPGKQQQAQGSAPFSVRVGGPGLLQSLTTGQQGRSKILVFGLPWGRPSTHGDNLPSQDRYLSVLETLRATKMETTVVQRMESHSFWGQENTSIAHSCLLVFALGRGPEQQCSVELD